MRRLYYYLNVSFSQSTYRMLGFWVPLTIILGMMITIIFVPYMLAVLYREEKYDWIFYFFILIILPAGAALVPTESMPFTIAANLMVFAFVMFYCHLIKIDMDDWIKEKLAKEYNDMQQNRNEFEAGGIQP